MTTNDQMPDAFFDAETDTERQHWVMAKELAAALLVSAQNFSAYMNGEPVGSPASSVDAIRRAEDASFNVYSALAIRIARAEIARRPKGHGKETAVGHKRTSRKAARK